MHALDRPACDHRAMPAARELRCLLIGVRGHGGEEVYSRALAEAPPAGVRVAAALGFHSSCADARCPVWAEVALNRLLYPFLAFDLGFRVLRVGDAVDLVHVHSHPTILRGRRRPVVFSAGSSHFHYLRDYERWPIERIAACYARARPVYARLGVIDGLLQPAAATLVYTFSHWARQAYLDHGVPAERVRVLYPGFGVPSEPEPAARSGRAGRGLTFLFMGRQAIRKGADAALRAFAELHARRPSTRLLYVSDAPPAPQDGVEALPLVPASAVGDVYARADVFVNPTRAEGFGFTNVEAQGHGLPVISSQLGAIPEVVEAGVTGLLVEPNDHAALVEAMTILAEDHGLRARLAAAARARFLRLFARPVFQAGLRALYDEALQRGAA
jgi:glycosyltransferase involved in cell wall biosynthesis